VTVRVRKLFKRETKAELSPMVQGTMKHFSIPHHRVMGSYYHGCILKRLLGDQVWQKGTKLI